MNDTDLARKSAEAFWQADSGTRTMGVDLIDVGPGRAVAELRITEDHLNGHGTGHGGVIYFLAIVAFGYAANTRNRKGFGQQASINYVAPVDAGDLLTATATETHLRGNSAIYDVAVTNQAGDLVATLRGMARSMNETWIAEG